MLQSTVLGRAFFSFLFAFVVFFFSSSSVFAATYEVTGFGWGADDGKVSGSCTFPPCTELGGLGWISFSNKSDGTAIPYGVFIDSITGDFSGYAWSSNIGWITFNAFEMQKCSTNVGENGPPIGPCPSGPAPKANVVVSVDGTGAITGGSGIVTGWARACAVFVSGCSGTVRSDLSTGTWDGWISLSGAGYGMRMHTTLLKFLGPGPNAFNPTPPFCPTCYAWGGDMLGATSGFGWGINLGGLKVGLVSGSLSPLLSFWADQTVLVSGQSTDLHWITSPGITSCTASSIPSVPSWTGAKLPAPTMRTQSTGPLTADQSYMLQCSDGPSDTPLRTVDITVTTTALSTDGACGTAAGVPSRSIPTANLCSAGNPGPVTRTDTWQWTCFGISGGADINCSALRKKSFQIIQF